MGRFALSSAMRWKLFWLSAVAALLLSAWLSRYDRDLRSADGQGIVALELAGTGARAESILCAWQQTVLEKARPPGPSTSPGESASSPGSGAARTALDRAEASLALDFLFLLLYPLAIGLGCCWAADVMERQGLVTPSRGGRLVRALAWAQVATAVFDLVEDLALVAVIGRFRDGEPVGDALPLLARWCAIPKFVLALTGLAVVLAGLIVRAVGRRRRPQTAGLVFALSVVGLGISGCAHVVDPGVPFAGGPRYDFCRHREVPQRPDSETVETTGDEVVVLRYLGAGGLYVGWRGAAVMTGPFFSNPGALRVGFGHVRPDRDAIVRGLRGVPVDRVGAILVGHSHYDHLGDLPVVASLFAPNASLLLNRSGRRALAHEADLTARMTTLEDIAGRWTRLHDVAGKALPFRVLAVPSDHAPHVRGMLVMDGESAVLDRPWNEVRYWALRTGRTYAFVLDLLGPPASRKDGEGEEEGDGAGPVRFRILLQDAASPAPADSLPPAEPGAQPYDLAVLCMPSADLVPPYPREVLRTTRPGHALVIHYENFFAGWGKSCRFAPFLSRAKANAFLEATDEAMAPSPGTVTTGTPLSPAPPVLGPAGERWTMPRVGEWLIFRPEPAPCTEAGGGTP